MAALYTKNLRRQIAYLEGATHRLVSDGQRMLQVKFYKLRICQWHLAVLVIILSGLLFVPDNNVPFFFLSLRVALERVPSAILLRHWCVRNL